jgi:PhnB protein
MASIHPHIHYNGNAEAAFTFYKSVFGGSFSKLMRFKELSTEGFQFPEEELEKIMHIALPIGGGTVLTGSDVPTMLGTVNENENRSKITVRAESKEEADALFNGLSVNGTVEFPMGNSPWGSYFGAFRDQYGVEWMIDYEIIVA